MKTDGIFTLHQCTIKCKCNDEFNLRPFGDVHRDNSALAKDKWEEFIENSSKLKNPLFLGMGDYFDSFSTSERVILGNPALHESTKKNLETDAKNSIKKFADEISFMKGHLIGLLGGNHFIQFADGSTGDMYLAKLLDTKYLGVCTATRLTFTTGKGVYERPTRRRK
jgi:hypothetical protein